MFVGHIYISFIYPIIAMCSVYSYSTTTGITVLLPITFTLYAMRRR